MTAQKLSELITQRAIERSQQEPDPSGYLFMFIGEVVKLRPRLQSDDEQDLLRELFNFGHALGLLESTTPFDVN